MSLPNSTVYVNSLPQLMPCSCLVIIIFVKNRHSGMSLETI